jgi:carboxymethylenebutenolidase
MTDTDTGRWHDLTIQDGTSMRAYVVRPERTARAPAVMVLPEAFGVNHHVRDVTARVAALGYVAASPELYHRTAPPGFETGYDGVWPTVAPHFNAVTDEGLAADLGALHAWLLADAQVDGNVGCIGFCMGGRAAFLANAILPLRCSASFYGGRIATQLLQHAPALHGPQMLLWGGRGG